MILSVNMPMYGEYSIPLGMTFILAFAFGASTVIFYFWLDVFVKTLTIRKLKRELRQYQGQPTAKSAPATAESTSDLSAY